MTNAIYNLHPENPLEIEVGLDDISQTTGREVALTSGPVTAIMTTSKAPDAVLADATLTSACIHIGTRNKWLVPFTATQLATALLRRLYGAHPLGESKTLFSDAFTRADSALTLGVPWATQYVQDPWGIDTNQAYPVALAAGQFPAAYVDVGAADVLLSATLSAVGVQGLVARYTGEDDAWLVIYGTGGLTLYENDGGVATVYGAPAFGVPAVGDVIKCRLQGTTITAWVERPVGTIIASISVANASEHLAVTKHGLYAQVGTARFSAFSIETIAPPTPYIIIIKPSGKREYIELLYGESKAANAR